MEKQAAILFDAYGGELDWDDLLKQRAGTEAINHISKLEQDLAKATKALECYACDCTNMCKGKDNTCGSVAEETLMELKQNVESLSK